MNCSVFYVLSLATLSYAVYVPKEVGKNIHLLQVFTYQFIRYFLQIQKYETENEPLNEVEQKIESLLDKMDSFNIDQDIDELKNTVNEFLQTALSFSKDNAKEYNNILVSKICLLKQNFLKTKAFSYLRMIFDTPKVLRMKNLPNK